MKSPEPMHPYRPWRDMLLIAAAGLIWQAVMASRLDHPSYMDAYYYATNGMRLAEGHGFTEQIIWQFLDDPDGLPVPSHTYWMPLPSIAAAAGHLLWPGFSGHQLLFWILAGLLPLLSYAVSRLLSGQRWQAWTAALLTMAGGFYLNLWGQPSTFAPFAWSAGICLYALARAGRSGASSGWWLVAGLAAGLGHLTRADGVLLLAVALFFWLRALIQEARPAADSPADRRLASAFWLALGYLVVMGPWFWRSWQLSGGLLPAAGTQTIFLTSYDDLFAYGRSFDLSTLQHWGWGQVIRSKVEGVWLALQTFVAVNSFTYLAPFVLTGWWRLRRSAELRPVTWYALVLYGVMSLIFTLPGARGGLFHSSVGLWPWAMVLAAAGIGFAVDWAASRLSHWQPERAKRIFAALFVLVAFAVSTVLAAARKPASAEADIYAAFGERLPDQAVVMVGNAPGFYYHTGLPAISVPNEPFEVLLQAAGRYGVTHLVLDQNRPQPLREFYMGDTADSRLRLVEEQDGYQLYELRPEAK